MTKNKKYKIIFFVLILIIFIPFVYCKYIQKFTRHITISAVQPTYTIEFNANGGTGTMPDQTFTYGTSQALADNLFTKTDYTFGRWNTMPDGSGDSYTNGQVIGNLTGEDGATIVLYAIWNEVTDKVAKIGNTYYETLQKAVNAVPTDGTETTIILLNNTSEVVTVNKGKNIILNLNGKTISNKGGANVIKNYATLKLMNGTITSSVAYGAVDNESTGILTIDSVNIIATGSRQTIYNNKGTLTITGSSYLSNSSTERASVQNVSGGTINILSGTIVASNFSGVENAGTLTIGTKDGDLNINSPIIQGSNYGVSTTKNISLYDGTLKGINGGINNVSKITSLEDNYGLVEYEEEINGVTYKTAYLGISNKVTFEGNGGVVTDSTKYVPSGKKVGTLPSAVRAGYDLIGWFTAKNGGSQITENTIINGEVSFYAHWNKINDAVRINSTYFGTLQEAIDSITDNTETTIYLEKDIIENVTIGTDKNIILNLNGKNFSNITDKAVIENSSNVTIINGTITSNSATNSVINNNLGKLTISNGARIIATGDRQAAYVVGGTIEITGNAYLSSQTSGKPTTTTMERGTVQCLTDGTLIITGGTIEGLKQQAVSSEGTLTIGVKDGNINSTIPVLIGKVYGVKSTGTFNFYDGIIKGQTSAISGNVAEYETNSQIVNGTETIGGSSYKTVHLEAVE